MTTRTIPIALTLDDGSVAVMHFVVEGQFSADAIQAMAERGDIAEVESLEEAPDAQVRVRRTASDASVQREIARSTLSSRVASWRRIGPGELPQDRRYRRSWKDFGDGVRLDMAKARAERLEQLRRQRAAVLEELDRDWMRATGQGKKVEADVVEMEREDLRNMPQIISAALEAAQSADDLDAIELP